MMHAARPAEYFEDSFLAWLDLHAGGYEHFIDAGLNFVLVNTNITYLEPIRQGQIVASTAQLQRSGRTSFTMRFGLQVNDNVQVEADYTYVCMGPDGPTAIPPELCTD